MFGQHPVEGHEPADHERDGDQLRKMRASLAAVRAHRLRPPAPPRSRSRSAAAAPRRPGRRRRCPRTARRPWGPTRRPAPPSPRPPRSAASAAAISGRMRQRRLAQVVDQQLGVVERRGAASGGGAQLLGDRIQLGEVAAEAEAIGLRVDVGGAQAVLGGQEHGGELARWRQRLHRLAGPPDQGEGRVELRGDIGPEVGSELGDPVHLVTRQAQERRGVGAAAAEPGRHGNALLDLHPRRRAAPATGAKRRQRLVRPGSAPRRRGRSPGPRRRLRPRSGRRASAGRTASESRAGPRHGGGPGRGRG